MEREVNVLAVLPVDMTDAGDVLEALEDYLDQHPEPFATAPDLADELDVGRRQVLDRLRLLEAADQVASRKVGRARVFWPTLPPAEPPAEPGDGAEFPPTETTTSTREPSAAPPAEPPAEPGALADLEFPGTRDRAECVDAIEAARDYLQENDRATMREIVRDVMPAHPLGYDVPDLEPGDRFRGAWWRRIIKPGLEALEDVEKPGRGGSEWRYRG